MIHNEGSYWRGWDLLIQGWFWGLLPSTSKIDNVNPTFGPSRPKEQWELCFFFTPSKYGRNNPLKMREKWVPMGRDGELKPFTQPNIAPLGLGMIICGQRYKDTRHVYVSPKQCSGHFWGEITPPCWITAFHGYNLIVPWLLNSAIPKTWQLCNCFLDDKPKVEHGRPQVYLNHRMLSHISPSPSVCIYNI